MQKPRLPGVSLDADQRELLEERIAIMVIDGGLDPAEAERRARECIAPKKPPKQEAAPEQMGFEGQGYKAMLHDFYRKR
jgi:hypothetical protein